MLDKTFYDDCSKDDLIDIILVNQLEKEKLLNLLKNYVSYIYEDIKTYGLLSNKI